MLLLALLVGLLITHAGHVDNLRISGHRSRRRERTRRRRRPQSSGGDQLFFDTQDFQRISPRFQSENLERVHVLATATATAIATVRNDNEQPLARADADRHIEISVLSQAGADQGDGRPSGCLGLLHRPLEALDPVLGRRPTGVVRHCDGATAPRSARPPFRRS